MTKNSDFIGGLETSDFSAFVRNRLPDRAVGSAKAYIQQYGALTAALRPLPDFLVIGAKKGGTTSVIDWLFKHPNVMRLFPRYERRKSPHYFDINFYRGESWYRGNFSSLASRALRAHHRGRPVVSGEASPYYLFHPACPERIQATVPRVKLIAILREPVSRAYSNYWDRRATGNEDLPTFEAAIGAEERRLATIVPTDFRSPRFYSFHHDHHSYLARGRYVEQLSVYMERFAREQLLILCAEDMFRDSDAAFERIQEFLGIPKVAVPLLPRNRRVSIPPIDPATQSCLAAYYAPYNDLLKQLIGEDFGW
jgi:hypothetical protein